MKVTLLILFRKIINNGQVIKYKEKVIILILFRKKE